MPVSITIRHYLFEANFSQLHGSRNAGVPLSAESVNTFVCAEAELHTREQFSFFAQTRFVSLLDYLDLRGPTETADWRAGINYKCFKSEAFSVSTHLKSMPQRGWQD